MGIIDAGRRHLADALTGKMSQCEVTEWIGDDGKPCVLYWKPLTGEQQKKIEAFDNQVDRLLMSVKVRALDADGKPVFAGVPIESMRGDFDFSVMRSIGYLMATDSTVNIDEAIEESEKE